MSPPGSHTGQCDSAGAILRMIIKLLEDKEDFPDSDV